MTFACRFAASAIIVGNAILTAQATCEPLSAPFHFPAAQPIALEIHPDDAKAAAPKMVIEGHATDAPWTRSGFDAYAITEDLFFLNSIIHPEDYVWNRSAKRLNPVGKYEVGRVKSLGCVLIRRSAVGTPADKRFIEILDFDPMTGETRVRYRKTGEHLYGGLLGEWDGKLVLSASAKSIVLLAPGAEPRTMEVDLGEFRWASNCDAIRAGKLLVYDPPDAYPQEYYFDVGICDLSTGKTRAIGKALGGWIPMGVDKPTMSVLWINEEEAKKRRFVSPSFLFGGGACMVEGTGELWLGAKE